MFTLGVDVGSTNTKVVLVAGAGEVRGARRADTPGDPDALVRLVRTQIAALADGVPVAAVGVASMAETGVPLDADDRPIGPLLRWDARRGTTDADRLADAYGRAALFAATGVRPAGKTPLATWAWLRRTRPEVFGRMARWAGVADLVGLALTGRLVTDHTLAGRTMAYRLPAADAGLPAGFDADLLDAVGLRPAQLPAVGPVARALPGVLPAGTPVVVAGHDHAVGAWAAGVRGAGAVADSLGTAESLIRVLGAPVDRGSVAAQGMSLVRTVGGREALVAGSPAAGAALDPFLAQLRPASGPQALDRDAVLAAASALPARPTGLVVLPYPAGRQCPDPDPSARLRVIGTGGGPAELTRALVEGLACQARWMYEAQRDLAAAPDGPVTVLGGTGPWLRVKAAVSRVPLRHVTAAEPVATGAALLAAYRAGLTAEPPGLPTGPLDAPDPGYEEQYRAFLRAARD
ncbi:MAG TPA: FGGY family carbohydrate kinase [Actinocatenispora sp.]